MFLVVQIVAAVGDLFMRHSQDNLILSQSEGFGS